MPATTNEIKREIGALCLLAVSLFGAVALLSFEEVGSTAEQGGLTNLCGQVGYQFALFVLHSFGFASWLLVFCVGFWGLALFFGKQLSVNTARIVGLWALVMVTATLLSHFFQGASDRLPDPGGFLGLYLNDLLSHRVSLGTGGTRILLVLMLMITLILATDWLFLSTLQGISRSLKSHREARRARAEELAGFDEYDEETEGGYAEEEEDAESPSIRRPVEFPLILQRTARAWRAFVRFFSGQPQGAAIADDLDVAKASLITQESVKTSPAKRSKKSSKSSTKPKSEPAQEWDEEEWSDGEWSEDQDWDEDGEWDEEDGEWDEEGDWDEEGEWDDDQEEWTDDGEEEDKVVVKKPGKGKGANKKPQKAKGKKAEPATSDPEETPDPPEPTLFDDIEEEPAVEVEAASKKKSKSKKKKEAEPEAPAPVLTTIDLPPEPDEPMAEPQKVSAPPTVGDQPYEFPPLSLLQDPKPVSTKEIDRHVAQCAKVLEETLVSFRIDGRVVETCRGPVITMFEIALKPGTKVDRLRSIEDELAMALKARTVRIVAPLIGKSTVGIEVPNVVRQTVGFKELVLAANKTQSKMAIPIMLGKDAAGIPLIDDLAQMPHMLVAGSTGSGKSVCLNTIIMSILYTRTPEQCKLILIDPKMVELSLFQNIAHLMCPVVTDMRRAATILDWAVEKMEARYEFLSRVGVRNIYSFNKLSAEEIEERMGEPMTGDSHPMPFIVIVVDELADLMMASGKEVEAQITRLAQKSRAVGIHVILATQRPSTNVITGLIKANMPTRISFMVTSKIDSRVILDSNGAEKLLGAGDMLYMPPRTSRTTRAQSSYVEDSEIRDVVKFIRDTSSPEYSKELIQTRRKDDKDPSEVDDLWNEAVEYVLETNRGSASLLQRRFKIGYTRASRLIDLMASAGVLGEYKGSQAREVLVSLEEWQARNVEDGAPLEG